MDSIISYYFTTARDPHGREPIKENDPNYIKTWYNSVIALGLQCVLFHDGFTQEFMDEFPQMRFIQVPPVPKGMQLHDYHWLLSHTYLHRHDDIENVFFTDCPDVKVVKNPFIQPEYDSNTDFAQAVKGWSVAEIMPVFDELMTALSVLNPRLYESVMRRVLDEQ